MSDVDRLVPGFAYTDFLEEAPAGLAGTLTYQLVEVATGDPIIAASNIGITESGDVPGLYFVTRTLPTDAPAGAALHVWINAGTSAISEALVTPPLSSTAYADLEGFMVTLGPLRFITAHDALKEALGDGLEAVGAVLTPADPKPRPFDLALPIRAPMGATDLVAAGNRMRRQVRSLLENELARREGLYFRFSVDTELEGWLQVGGADLEYMNEGGAAFGEYLLTLTDCYLVARPWTHRHARALSATDYRLATTARDFRRRFYATGFAGMPASARHWLPVGADDTLESSTNDPLPLGFEFTADGPIPLLIGEDDLEVVSYSIDTDDLGLGDVRVWDPDGLDLDTLDEHDLDEWAQVYGPAFPLTDGWVPTLENARCRVSFAGATGSVSIPAAFKLETYDVALAEWVELGLITPTTTVTTLIDARVVEWTPDRAVVLARFDYFGTAGLVEVYLTLQRGWTGPRVEVYNGPAGTLDAGILAFITAKSGAMTASKYDDAPSPGGTLVTRAGNPIAGAPGAQLGDATFTGENWIELRDDDPVTPLHSVALVTLDDGAYGQAGKSSSLIGANLYAADTSGLYVRHDTRRYIGVHVRVYPYDATAASARTEAQAVLIDARQRAATIERR